MAADASYDSGVHFRLDVLSLHFLRLAGAWQFAQGKCSLKIRQLRA